MARRHKPADNFKHLFAFSDEVDKCIRTFVASDISMNGALIIVTIQRRQVNFETTNVQQLGQLTNLPRATLGRVLSDLVTRGFIAEHIDPDDRRKRLLTIPYFDDLPKST